MKILYVGDLSPTATCRHRYDAMRRLGLALRPFDTHPYVEAGGRARRWLRFRLMFGRNVHRLNRDVLAAAADFRPDLIWFDKPIFMYAATLERLKAPGRLLVNYVIDNPFHLLPGEPGWRRLRGALPLFDAHVTPRPSSVEEYRAAGAGGPIAVMPLAFEPYRDFPPPPGAGVSPQDGVVFIGSPYDGRPRFFAELAAAGIPVTVRGARWERYRHLAGPNLRLHPSEDGDAYRSAMWNSKILLGMVTHSHREPWAHRAFEIAGAGGFLLAERTPGHVACFEEGREAEFFAGAGEAAEKIRRYLADDDARRRVARAGLRRAWTSGYTNDERLAAALQEIAADLVPGDLAARAATIIARRRRELEIA
jgi:spore maturation protein CgeB